MRRRISQYIRRLFCSHEWKFVERVDYYDHEEWRRRIYNRYECTKCSKSARNIIL